MNTDETRVTIDGKTYYSVDAVRAAFLATIGAVVFVVLGLTSGALVWWAIAVVLIAFAISRLV